MSEKASIGVVNCHSLGGVRDNLAVSGAVTGFGPVDLNIVSVEEAHASAGVIESTLPSKASAVTKSLVRAFSVVGAALLGAIPVALLEAPDTIEEQVGKRILADMVGAPGISEGGCESEYSNNGYLYHG